MPPPCPSAAARTLGSREKSHVTERNTKLFCEIPHAERMRSLSLIVEKKCSAAKDVVRHAMRPEMMKMAIELAESDRSSKRTPDGGLLLVLENDEQFVEAARVLAQRTLAEATGDAPRLERLFRRVLSRWPEPEEMEALSGALLDFHERFAARPDDAASLVEVGEAPVELPAETTAAELAAWTMISSAILNLFETTNPR